MMERLKSSTERASSTGSAFSRRRSYIPAAVPVSIMSSDVFVQQLFSVFPAYSAMDSDLRLEVGEEPLKGVVGVGDMYGGVLRLILPSCTRSLTTSLYLSYHSLNAPMKLSLSVTVMPFTSSSRFRDASTSGSCVRYLRTMGIWWNWHIWTRSGFRACGRPFIPSIMTLYILNPLPFSQSTPST